MDWDNVVGSLAEDVVYHNIPMEKVQGREAAAAVITGMRPTAVFWEMISIAENGDKVLTERIDNFDMPTFYPCDGDIRDRKWQDQGMA